MFDSCAVYEWIPDRDHIHVLISANIFESSRWSSTAASDPSLNSKYIPHGLDKSSVMAVNLGPVHTNLKSKDFRWSKTDA
jgi:hypothetical protein